MTAQKKLPKERKSITRKFELGTLKVYAIVGLREDGTVGEIFLRANSVGSTERGLLHAIGLLISISLQHDVPLAMIVDKLKDVKFEPSGLTKDPAFQIVSSLLDYIARWLEEKFLK